MTKIFVNIQFCMPQKLNNLDANHLQLQKYDHNNKRIVELTLFWQFQQELNIIIFLNVEFVADLIYWTELNCISIPNKVYIYITYPINAVVELAPGPDRVRITHRLTVEYSTLALILILTALVARNLRSS